MTAIPAGQMRAAAEEAEAVGLQLVIFPTSVAFHRGIPGRNRAACGTAAPGWVLARLRDDAAFYWPCRRCWPERS